MISMCRIYIRKIGIFHVNQSAFLLIVPNWCFFLGSFLLFLFQLSLICFIVYSLPPYDHLFEKV